MADFIHGDQLDLQQTRDVKHSHDLEKGHPEKDVGSATVADRTHSSEEESDEIVLAKNLREQKGFLRTLRRGEEWLDEKMGIETQGIDRIPEEDKQPPSILNVFFLWWSLTCHAGSLTVGILGTDPAIYGLSLHQSILVIIIGTILGAACTAYCGTLGPKLGLRAIACSRYSFGFYGAKLCSILNVVIGGGFAVVNIVVVGQILAAVSDYKMTIVVGIIIIAIISYVVSIFGFQFIHTWEKYSWIATFIIMCVLMGQITPKMEPDLPSVASGLSFSGSWLSFFAVCFSSSSGWCSIASDYYCNYPANTKGWKIFYLTIMGVSLPTIFVTVIGACLGNVALASQSNPTLTIAYQDHGLGGLLLESFHPFHFAKFSLVLLVFSVIGNNVAVNYSSGLSLQLLGHYFHAIPRFIWSFANAIVIAVLAIAGREHLSVLVSDFVSLLGYWTVSFTFILLIEDKWFRRTEGYELNFWDRPDKLPWGLAAVMALLIGYLAGGLPGMAQVWYVGPIAAKFGPYGGDVGIFLSAVFTIVTYVPMRWYERKVTGR